MSIDTTERASARTFVRKLRARYPRVAFGLLVFLVFLPFLAVYLRPLWQPYVLAMRMYSGAFILFLVLVGICWFMTKSRWPVVRVSGLVSGIVMLAGAVMWGPPVYRHLADYIYYIGLDVTEFSELPLTDHERIIPLAGVHTLYRERMNETEEPTGPDFVRIGNEYRWTAAVQPSSNYSWQRLMGNVDEIISIPATSPAPNLDRRQPIKVNFEVGENLLLSAKVDTCVRRSFGLWRFFSYEPGNVFYMKNDRGEWVMVVALMRWSGILFPRPAFGGVQVIEQGKSGFLKRGLVGCGTWIPPEKVGNYAYLRGQNILAYEVSRYIAESFRFQAGFAGPLPWSRKGDIRIADMPDDVNEQPFTLFFKRTGEEKGTLYHYFALEPYDSDKQGLAVSLLIPADGEDKIFVYRHFERGESPLGVTAVGAKVQESKKNYDWSKNQVVEFRPYLKRLPDTHGVVETRFCWLATVVTLKGNGPGKGSATPALPGNRFIPGSIPEMACVDAFNGGVVWLDSLRPELWPEQLREHLGARWAER